MIGSFIIAIIIFVSCAKNPTPQLLHQPTMLLKQLLELILIRIAHNYANQPKPPYIVKENTGGNVITNAKATLGRVLFYDKNLSIDNSISCASCHKQEFAFGDTALVSKGVSGGVTAILCVWLMQGLGWKVNSFGTKGLVTGNTNYPAHTGSCRNGFQRPCAEDHLLQHC